MNRIILVFLLAVFSSSVMAEWVPLTHGNDKNTTIYANPDTIRRSSNKVKLLIMFDYKMPKTVAGSKPYFSTKYEFEVDCNGDQSRLLGVIAFSGNMGAGEVIYTHNFNNDWTPVRPESLDQGILNFACGLKAI
jgi:Surface-adhesin protein E